MLTPAAILAECRRRANEALEQSSADVGMIGYLYWRTQNDLNSLADWIEREMRKENPQ